MADHYVRSFVEKFHHLWRDGKSAHLDLDCHAGEAWVGLRLRLGHPRAHGRGPQQNHDRVRRRGPGYSRRLERRAAQRAAAAGEPQVQTVEPVHAEQAQTGVDQVETEPVKAGKADAAAVNQVEADLTEQVVTEAVKLVDNVQAEQAQTGVDQVETVQVVTKAVKLADKYEAGNAPVAAKAVEGAKGKIEEPRGRRRRDFECEVCDFTTERAARLRDHLARMHTTLEQLDGCTDHETEMEFDLERERVRRQSRWLNRSEPVNGYRYASRFPRNKY